LRSILHIGGNKTASTLLQRRLFAKHPKIGYVGEDCSNYEAFKNDIDNFIHEDDSIYQYKKINKIFDETKSNKDIFIFSNEDIMGTRHPSVTARRLKSHMPEAKVVMVLRNQKTALATWYVNHGSFLKPVPKKYWRKYVELSDWLSYCFAFPHITVIDAMNYEKYYKIFAKEFGEDNLYIILYEDLLKNKDRYYKQWSDLLGLDTKEISSCLEGRTERKSLTWLEFKLHQLSGTSIIISKLITFIVNPLLSRGSSAKITLPKKWQNKVHDYYSEGNSILNKRFNLNLEKYNYPLKD